MNKSVIAIQFFFVITTILYVLLVPVVFVMDNAHAEGETFVVNDDDETMMYSQQAIEVETKECISPCPSSAEMCIEICA